MGSSKKRIAYLCLEGTVEGQASYTHVYEIIEGLKNLGWEITLYQPQYSLPHRKPGPLIRLLKFTFIQIKLWLNSKPNIIYIRSHFASWLTALWARMRGIPVVQEVNGPYEDLFLAWPFTRKCSGLFKWMIRVQLRLADVVIAVTPQLANWVKQEAGKEKNVVVIPNGVNTDLFRPDAPLQQIKSLPEKYVVFFGALAPWQGIDTMLEAVKQHEWPSDVKLVIVGDGVEREKVERAAQNNKRVLYLGKIPYGAVPGVVARALAGLSPQNLLGNRGSTGLFPLKVLETLACGIPVVVTDFPGIAEVVKENRCGVVIPPDNPSALAQAVKYLCEHPEERIRMGRVGRVLMIREYSWASRAVLTDTVLRELLDRRT